MFASITPLYRAATRLGMLFRPYVLHVDVPADGALLPGASTIQGWYLAPRCTGDFSLQLAGMELKHVEVERPDAQRFFGSYVHGFRAVADLDAVAGSAVKGGSQIKLELARKGAVVTSKILGVSGLSRDRAERAAQARAKKREWLLEHLVCPECRGSLQTGGRELYCSACSCRFEDDGKVFNFLSAQFKRKYNIGAWDDISMHPYDDVAREVIESVRRSGGKVLDCGSGLRPEPDETVICLEVDSFPNVDLLAVNQKLPFADGAFEAVLSLNVLEHVTDPFACAGELARVLKPGGTLYCCIPFLQPEHGYPSHYFNATRCGLQQLFADKLNVDRHFVPGSGEPIWTLHWFLSWYLRELPEADRTAFLNLRIADILATPALQWLSADWVRHLSENGKWRLGATTAALFKKPE